MKHLTNFLLVISFFSISTALYAAGEVVINTGLTIDSNGRMVSSNGAELWNDLNVFPDATTRSSSVPPTFSLFKTDGAGSQGVFLNYFSASTEQELYFTIQLPHGYKEGTTLKPHVHWTPTATDATSYVVVWGLEYSIMKVGGTFGNTTTITGSTTNITVNALGQHVITILPDITSPAAPNHFTISTVLVCRVFRKATDGADAYASSAGLLGIDFHYQSDMTGSRTDIAK